MKRFAMLLVLLLAALAGAKNVWMEKGTVAGTITRIDANDTVISREFTLTTDGVRTRYDVHFTSGGYEDYSQLRSPLGVETLTPNLRYYSKNSVLGLDYVNSILLAGLNDGRHVELNAQDLPTLVYDDKVTWRFSSWQPGVIDYAKFNLAPRSEDNVEYWVSKGNTLIYTNTSEMPVDALLASRIANPTNCAAGSIAAMADVLGKTVDISKLQVDEQNNTTLSNVVSVLRSNKIDVTTTILDLDALREDDVTLAKFPGADHLVLLAHVTDAGAWMVDMTQHRFLGYVSRASLDDAFAEATVALVVSEDHRFASNDQLLDGLNVAGRECNWQTHFFFVFNCASYCEGSWCGWMYDRWNCGDGVGTCYDRAALPWSEGAPCYEHPTYGCIGDWTQKTVMGDYFCG